MTEQDLEYIKNTIDYMLNNSRHKNHEHVYNNASNSINKLEKAIEVMHSCKSDSELLIAFAEWKEYNGKWETHEQQVKNFLKEYKSN